MLHIANRPGDIAPAISNVLVLVQELESDIAAHEDPDWIAANGPRLKRIQDANILYYRDTDTVRQYTQMPKGDFRYDAASQAFLRLAATCLKIAVDYQAAKKRAWDTERDLATDGRHSASLMRELCAASHAADRINDSRDDRDDDTDLDDSEDSDD